MSVKKLRTRHRTVLALTGFALAASAGAAYGVEIEKIAAPNDHGLHFYWWPKLRVPAGWVHDENLSMDMKSNVLVPKGKTFSDAETVMYARAFYEPDKKKRGTFQEFVMGDVKGMRDSAKGVVVSEVKALSIANGKALKTFSFTVPKATYEQVAYGSEGDFWIEFVISSKSKAGLVRDLPIFRSMLSAYRIGKI